MQELVSRLMEQADLNEDQARRTIAIVIGFLKDAGPRDEVETLMAQLPGARKVESPFDGSFTGPMGAMAAFNALSASGLGMTQMQAATREFVVYAKEQADEETVNHVIRSIPGLSQFV